jgi:hypothetical protein
MKKTQENNFPIWQVFFKKIIKFFKSCFLSLSPSQSSGTLNMKVLSSVVILLAITAVAFAASSGTIWP